MNIEAWVIKAKEGDNSSLEKIINALTPLIIKESSKVFLKGHDREDLIQIGYLSLFNAIEKYDVTKSNFPGYAAMAIRNNFYYLIRKEYKSQYEGSLNKEIGEDISVEDTLSSKETIEEDFIKREEYKRLHKALRTLSKEELYLAEWIYFEKRKLKCYAKEKGLTYSQARYLRDKVLKKIREEMSNE